MNPTQVFLLPLISLFIPIIAIVMGMGIAMLAIYTRYQKSRQMFELYHKERLAAIDKGIELPPIPAEFFTDNGKPHSPHGTLLTGLIFTLAGLGTLIALQFYHPESALYALIPIGLGSAFLIYYFTIGRKEAAAIEQRRRERTVEDNRLAKQGT